jgi:sugar phosphate isomerase/epimerase
MILTGFTDEVSTSLDKQIDVCKALDWSYIDLRTVGEKNICHLSSDEFEILYNLLDKAELKILCFGSPIANWSRSVDYPLKDEILELQKASRLMKKGNVPYIRIMSYALETPSPVTDSLGMTIAKRLNILAKVAEDEGIILLHENCETWGGQSRFHTQFLLDNISSPSFKLIFDTGNPPGTLNITGESPYQFQDSLNFLKSIYDSVELVHIKDAKLEDSQVIYKWPGEGDARIGEILTFLKSRDFKVPISIEPHLEVVYHDKSVKSSTQKQWDTFIEYAERANSLLYKAGFSVN